MCIRDSPIAVEGSDSWDAHGYAGALRNAILLLSQISPQAKVLLISPTYCQFYKDGAMYTDSNMKDYGQGTLTPVSYTHLDVYKRQGLHCPFPVFVHNG